VIDANDIRSLKEVILFVAGNKPWRDRVGKRNRNVALEYSWERSAYRLVSFYQEILKNMKANLKFRSSELAFRLKHSQRIG